MLFQIITAPKSSLQKQSQLKNTFPKIYTNLQSQKIVNSLPTSASRTWKYYPILENKNIEYANLYCGGKTLDDACPPFLKGEWDHKKARLKAFYRSCVEARIDLQEHSFYDFVPEHALLEYLHLKNDITNYVFENYQKPKNYDFLLSLTKIMDEIKEQKLNIDTTPLKRRLAEFKVHQFYKKAARVQPHVSYNIFGTKTGRLTTAKNSFPIMTMDKSYRSILKPQNDFFVELDFNAAELRTLLALGGKKQPKEDIHQWNADNVYRGVVTREEAKQRIFAWLYNPNSKDYLSSGAYQREEILTKYWDGTHVTTYFHREIEADKHHALNYIVQSTTSDIFLDRLLAVHKYLEDKKSFISFSIHDSLVIDFAEKERDLILEIAQIFSQTIFSDFLTNVRTGKNYGEMREICKI